MVLCVYMCGVCVCMCVLYRREEKNYFTELALDTFMIQGLNSLNVTGMGVEGFAKGIQYLWPLFEITIDSFFKNKAV